MIVLNFNPIFNLSTFKILNAKGFQEKVTYSKEYIIRQKVHWYIFNLI